MKITISIEGENWIIERSGPEGFEWCYWHEDFDLAEDSGVARGGCADTAGDALNEIIHSTA